MRSLSALLVLVLLACATQQAQTPPEQGRVARSREIKEREESPGARIAWESARRLPAGVQNVDPKWLADAQKSMRAMPKLLAKRAHEWKWLGPMQLGGRTRALAFSPKPPHTLYVGAASGGMFKSNDEGRTFEFSGAGLVHLSIGAIAVHADGKGLLVGTGELYRNTEHPYSAMSGGGIFESLDGGANFSPWRSSQNTDFAYVSDLVISPRNPKRIYIASNSGIWRTVDGGKTLQRLLRPATGDLAQYEGCTELELYVEDGKEQLLASCASRSVDDRYYLPGTVFSTACAGPCPSALFRSADASAANVNFDVVLSEPGMGRSSIARAPSDPKVLYLLSASILTGPDRNGDFLGDYDNGLHALFRSNDGGLSWQAQLRNTSDDVFSTFVLHNLTGAYNNECRFFSGGNDYYAAGWYDQTIAVDPKSADTVWVGGIDLFRSDDGGRSFGVSSYWWEDAGNPGAVHGDHHVLLFHPQYDGNQNRKLFIGNDGGVATTTETHAPTNRGPLAACSAAETTARFQRPTSGLGSSQFYHGSVSRDGSQIVAGAQDNGTWLLSSLGANFGASHIFGGDGSYSAIDPRDSRTLYVSSQFGNLYRVALSDFGQNNYVRIGQGVPESGIFITPFSLDSANPDRLWLGTKKVWRSANKGATWERASADFGSDFNDQVNAIASHPSRPGGLIVGTANGIYRNPNAYTSAQNSVWLSTKPRAGWVSSLVFDPSDAQTVYATYSTFGGAHVWRSRDGGASFTAIDNNLPNLPAHSLAVHPTNSQLLYLGTDLGLFVSANGGESWSAEESGFGQAIVETLVINAQAPHFLNAFTYGRGIWRIPLEQIDAQSFERTDPQYTGHWWNPSQSGQGLHMEALNLNDVPQLLVSWYTYKDGKPHWLYGVGPLKGARASVPLVSLSGADFPPLFKASEVQQTPFATVEIEFQTPQLAHLSYPGGTLDLQPLTRPSYATPRASTQLSECHSGNWYQPENSGHGLSVLVHPPGIGAGAEAIITWYVYLKGEGFYLVGNGAIENGVAKIAAYRTEGAQFGPAFRTNDVRLTPVGEMRLSAIDADQTRFEWDLDPAAMNFDPANAAQQRSGSLIMTRLTTVAGLNCES